jgi:hypothetical protein
MTRKRHGVSPKVRSAFDALLAFLAQLGPAGFIVDDNRERRHSKKHKKKRRKERTERELPATGLAATIADPSQAQAAQASETSTRMISTCSSRTRACSANVPRCVPALSLHHVQY